MCVCVCVCVRVFVCVLFCKPVIFLACLFIHVSKPITVRMVLSGTGIPGRRPLAGLSEVTIPFTGDSIRPHDNFRGSSPNMLKSRGIYVMSAGSGVVHSHQDCISNHADSSSYTHHLRLWIDMGGAHERMYPPPLPQILTSKFLPKVCVCPYAVLEVHMGFCLRCDAHAYILHAYMHVHIRTYIHTQNKSTHACIKAQNYTCADSDSTDKQFKY